VKRADREQFAAAYADSRLRLSFPSVTEAAGAASPAPWHRVRWTGFLDYEQIARESLAEAQAVDEAFGEARGDELPPELANP
jgi:hypothetical protein